MLSIYDIDNWAEYTYYEIDKIVIKNLIYYYCIVNHTSSDDFLDHSGTHWSGITTFNSKSKPYFHWVPSNGSAIQNRPKLKEVQFGDGYAQRIPDGINNNLLILDLTFDELKLPKAKAILHFLDTRKGAESFVFTPPEPYNKNKLFICKEWTPSINFYNNITVKAQFTEVPA